MSLLHQAKDFERQKSFLFLKKRCAYSSAMIQLKTGDEWQAGEPLKRW